MRPSDLLSTRVALEKEDEESNSIVACLPRSVAEVGVRRGDLVGSVPSKQGACTRTDASERVFVFVRARRERGFWKFLVAALRA